MSQSEEHEVMKDRQKVYGPTGPNFEAFADALTALLEAHFQQKLPGRIPPHVAALVYAQGKLIRMALPFSYNRDSMVDLKAYAEIADQLDPRKDIK